MDDFQFNFVGILISLSILIGIIIGCCNFCPYCPVYKRRNRNGVIISLPPNGSQQSSVPTAQGGYISLPASTYPTHPNTYIHSAGYPNQPGTTVQPGLAQPIGYPIQSGSANQTIGYSTQPSGFPVQSNQSSLYPIQQIGFQQQGYIPLQTENRPGFQPSAPSPMQPLPGDLPPPYTEIVK